VTAFSDISSTITFLNTTAQTLSSVVFKVYSPIGLTGTRVLDIGPYSGFSGKVTDLIPRVSPSEPGLPRFDEGYATLEVGASTGSLDALVGFETYGGTGDGAALNAATNGSVLRAGYLPHFVVGGGYRTTLRLINASDTEQIIEVIADGIDEAGQSIPAKSTARTLSPNQFLQVDVAQQFAFRAPGITVGYLRWNVPLNSGGVIGFLDYGTTDGVLLTAIQAPATMGTRFLASQIAEGSGLYTGLAFLNSTTQGSTVQIRAFSPEGQLLASTTFGLAAGERRSRLLRELLPEVSQQLGGYVGVESSQPIFMVEVFGSSDSLRFLANVPAQVSGTGIPVPQPVPPGPPAHMTQVGQVSATMPVRSTFTFGVLITDASGLPIPGVRVRFSQTAGANIGLNSIVVTGITGEAKLRITLFSVAGIYSFHAKVDGLSESVSISIEAQSPPPPPSISGIIPSVVPVGARDVEMSFTGTNLDAITELLLPFPYSITFRDSTVIKTSVTVPINSSIGEIHIAARTANGQIGIAPTIQITTPSGISVQTGFAPTVFVGGQVEVRLGGTGTERIRGLKFDDVFITVGNPTVQTGEFRVVVSVADGAPIGNRPLIVVTDEGEYRAGILLVWERTSGSGICCTDPVSARVGETIRFVVTMQSSGVPLSGLSFLRDGIADPRLEVTKLKRISNQNYESALSIAGDAPAGERTLVVMTSLGAIVTNQKFLVVEPDGTLPVLYSVAPAEGRQATSVWVTLTGAGLVSGSTLNISGTGVTVLGTPQVFSGRMSAVLSIDSDAAPGARELTVTTPAGTTRGISFTVLNTS